MRLLAALVVALAASPASAAVTEQQAYRAGLDAYVYAYPPVLSQLSADKIPAQTLININAVSGPQARAIVLPNVDTPYSVANLDLKAEPFVLHVPSIPTDRYYVFEFLDAYTNVLGYVGTRTTGTEAGDYALTGPDFSGTLPAGVKQIKSTTNRIVIVGRTLFFGPDDLPNVRTIQEQYGLTPLSQFTPGGEPKHGVILDESPKRTPPVLPTGLAFFDFAGDVMAAQAPPQRDAKILARLKQVGIGPGLHPSSAGLPAAVQKGLTRAVADGQKQVAKLQAKFRADARKGTHGWNLQTGAIGHYGTDYVLRAVTAKVGLWANSPDEAYYPFADQDAKGRRLDGARHDYLLHFAKGQIPPARAFWSLTMYDKDLFLYANELDRYGLGDRSAMKRDKDGGLTIYLQHARPAAAKVSNWLPAPATRFTVTLRLYDPAPKALNGGWKPPGITRVR